MQLRFSSKASVLIVYGKIKTMDNKEKLDIMDKIIRELVDINNSSTSLLKKITQAESQNINLGDKILDNRLPDLHEKIDAIVTDSASLISEFTEVRDKFYTEKGLGEPAEGA